MTNCCRHAPNQHSSLVGCLHCRCLWLALQGVNATVNPKGKYAKEYARPLDTRTNIKYNLSGTK